MTKQLKNQIAQEFTLNARLGEWHLVASIAKEHGLKRWQVFEALSKADKDGLLPTSLFEE